MKVVITIKTPNGKVDENIAGLRDIKYWADGKGYLFETRDEIVVPDDPGDQEDLNGL